MCVWICDLSTRQSIFCSWVAVLCCVCRVSRAVLCYMSRCAVSCVSLSPESLCWVACVAWIAVLCCVGRVSRCALLCGSRESLWCSVSRVSCCAVLYELRESLCRAVSREPLCCVLCTLWVANSTLWYTWLVMIRICTHLWHAKELKT